MKETTTASKEIATPGVLPSQQDELEKSFYQMLMQAPVAMVVFRGPDYIVEVANEQYLQIIGKSLQQVIDQPAFKVMPKADTQGFREILDTIRKTGEPLRLNEHKTFINRNGGTETAYLNLVYQPLKKPGGLVDKIMIMITEVTELVVDRMRKEEERLLLQKTRDQLSLSINAGSIGIWSWDVKNDVLTWSREQCRFFGLSEDEFSGKVEDFMQFVVPEDLQLIYQKGEFADSTPGDYEYQFRIRRKDGQIRWLQARSRTIYSNEGELLFITGVNIDITEQKEAEEKLRQSEQRFGAAVEAVQGILWTNNARGEMEGEQPGWEALTGQTYNEYQGYGWAKAIHPDDAQATVDAWNEAVQQRITFVFEHRVKTSDGSWGRFSVRAIPVLQPDGTIREWVGVHTNITEQRRAEESLQESEKRFRTLAETLPQLVWMTDEKGNYEYASRQWFDYAGYNPQEEGTWKKIVHPEDIAPIMAVWQHSLQTGELYRAEVRLRNRNGDYRWHFVQGEPLHNEEGRVVKWIGAFTDIHDQKTLARKLEKLVAERTKELQRSNEDLQQFAHVASHDLKEPVRKIRTFGSRLANEFEGQLPPEAKVYLNKMESAANRMYAMIDGVLMYSSLNAMEDANEQINLTELVQQVQSDLEILIQEKDATLVYDNLPSVAGAPVLLYQLFYNLINNSLKFARPDVKPHIHITAQTVSPAEASTIHMDNEKTHIKITLQDNGIGFEQEDAERIFQTFSRLNPKDRYEGTGLGLALCKKIVERHGGVISATAKKDEGACFTILLPVSR